MAKFQGTLKNSQGKAVKQTMVAESLKEAR